MSLLIITRRHIFRLLLLTSLLLMVLPAMLFAGVPSYNYVRTDDSPYAILYDPVHQVVFASVPTLNVVDVIAPSTGQIIAKIPVTSPAGMDLTPDASRLIVASGGRYAATSGSEFLTLIDPANLQVVSRVPLPILVWGQNGGLFQNTVTQQVVAMSNGKVFMRANQINSVTTYLLEWDLASGEIQPRPTPTNGETLQLFRSANRNRFVALPGFFLYDVSADDFVAQSNAGATAVALNSDGSQVAAIVACCELTIFDGNLNQIFDLQGDTDLSAVFYSQNGAELFVVSDRIWVYDTHTFALLGEIPVLQTPGEFTSTQILGFDGRGFAFGINERGVGFVDVSSPRKMLGTADLSQPNGVSPPQGAMGAPGPSTLSGLGLLTSTGTFFGGIPVKTANVVSDNMINVTPPPAASPGPVDVSVQTALGWTVFAPQGYSYGPQVLYEQINGGPTSGGTVMQIIGYGFGSNTSQIQVLIGGVSAVVQSVSIPGMGISPFPLPMQTLTVTTPPGNLGPADLTVSTTTGTTTVKGDFTYHTVTQAGGSANVSQMIYDPTRQQLYLADDDANRIDVFSTVTGSFLAPLPSGLGPAGLALTPDASTLLVTNYSEGTVSVISLANPASAYKLSLSSGGVSGQPVRIGATSTGKAFITVQGAGGLTELDLASGTFTVRNDGPPTPDEIAPSSDGSRVYVAEGGLSNTTLGLWSAATDSFQLRIVGGWVDFAVNSTADLFAGGLEGTFAIYRDDLRLTYQLDSLDLLSLPIEEYGQKLHPSGALLYAPFKNAVEIFDVHTGALLQTIGLPTLVSPMTDTMALDNTGKTIFLTGEQGLMILQLSSVPLSIGEPIPAFGSVAGGDSVQVRGSGFLPGAAVSMGGVALPTTYVDANTLQIATPATAAGNVAVTVNNANGQGYTLPAAFTFVGTLPKLSSAAPSSADAVGQQLDVALYGSDFLPTSVASWNGSPRPTQFADSTQLVMRVQATDTNLSGTAQITVSDSRGTSNPLNFPVVANPGQLQVTGNTFLGYQLLGQSGPAIPFQVTNTSSTGTVQISKIVIVSSPADFMQNNNCPSSLGPAQGCTINVTFNPQQLGSLQGTLQIESNALDGPIALGLSGDAVVHGPSLLVSSQSIMFPAEFVGSGSSNLDVVITSVGDQPVTISNITASGDFSDVVFGPCSPMTTPEYCSVAITFQPTGSGIRTGALSVYSNDPNSPATVSLSGAGISTVVIEPTSWFFGSQPIATSSAKSMVTLTNMGSSPVTISNVVLTGADNNDFGMTHNCPLSPSTVAASASCVIQATFTPKTSGPRKSSITVAHSLGTQTLVLTGVGTAISTSPTNLTFGSQPVGTPSASMPVVITNAGSSSVSLYQIAFIGADAGDFSISNTSNCGSSLRAGASCTVNVVFTPASVGSRTASLMISNDGGGSPQAVPVSGIGTSGAVATLSASSLVFAEQAVGTVSSAQRVVLSNRGTLPLAIRMMSGVEAASSEFIRTNTCGSSLAAGASCTIEVRFAPRAAGARTAVIGVLGNGHSAGLMLHLEGTGIGRVPRSLSGEPSDEQ